MSREPLLNVAAITSVVGALITLLVAFGVNMTPDQQTAIMGFVSVLAPWIVALVARRFVTPLSSPRDEDGQPLTRAGSEAPTLRQQRSAGGR